MRQDIRQTLRLIREDIYFRCEYEHKPTGTMALLKMLIQPGVFCVALYRWQVFLDTHHLRPLAGILKLFNLLAFGVSIDSRAMISGGLVIIHANSIYISDRVQIGARCILFHQNWIGYSPFAPESTSDPESVNGPIIGASIIFGAGACAVGPIALGDGCKVGVNASVDSSFPAGAVLFGVPARQISKS
ncbi:MAG: serine O-acetyltransferase [Acidiferrobacteraceae bacterium]